MNKVAYRNQQAHRKCDFPAVPAEYLPQLVGRRVHLSWAYAGASWVLEEIMPGSNLVRLRTPKTGKVSFANANEVCFTRGQSEAFQATA